MVGTLSFTPLNNTLVRVWHAVQIFSMLKFASTVIFKAFIGFSYW